jgi:hypothetical protein
MRGCPACRKEWPDDREVCPDCLASLVADLDATITCRSCGHVCPARMQTCPSCFALLRAEDIDRTEELERALASGRPLRRPVGQAPFSGGPGATVCRLTPRGPLVLLGADGLIEAGLTGRGIGARPPLTCTSAGQELFRLHTYDAARAALVAIDPAGAPIATFLRDGAVAPTVHIRDETSAPVARVQTAGRGAYGFEVIETGGARIAHVTRLEVLRDEWEDDEWTVRPVAEALPLPPLAVVALAVACKVLLGRAEPVHREPRPAQDAAGARGLAALVEGLLDD